MPEEERRHAKPAKFPIPIFGNKPNKDDGDDDERHMKFTLREFVNSVAMSVLNAKAIIDEHSLRLRREKYGQDEFMRMLPISMYEITDVEVELKFVPERIVKSAGMEDVLINIDPDKISTLQNAVSTIKFKIRHKPMREYVLEEGVYLREE
jgi:hypothetical protein